MIKLDILKKSLFCLHITKSLIFMGVLAFLIINCAGTPKLKISTLGVSSVSIVSANAPDKVEEKLGKTPIVVASEKLQGKLLKVSQPSRLPIYVLPVTLDATDIDVVMKLQAPSEISDLNDSQVTAMTLNRTHRLLMQAYDAMAREDGLSEALELADEMLKLNRSIAAPFIIKGLVYLQQGKGSNAKKEFETAKELDPSDGRLESLIKAASEGL